MFQKNEHSGWKQKGFWERASICPVLMITKSCQHHNNMGSFTSHSSALETAGGALHFCWGRQWSLKYQCLTRAPRSHLHIFFSAVLFSDPVHHITSSPSLNSNFALFFPSPTSFPLHIWLQSTYLHGARWVSAPRTALHTGCWIRRSSFPFSV